jgi:hypothetical protein
MVKHHKKHLSSLVIKNSMETIEKSKMLKSSSKKNEEIK